MENEKVMITVEVFAEIVYVLEKVYKISRLEIRGVLNELLNMPNVICDFKELLVDSLERYAEINIDFVDSILASYKKCFNYEIYTFDKKLIKVLGNI